MVAEMVNAGFEVYSIDHQSMGFSDGIKENCRMYFDRFEDLLAEQAEFTEKFINATEARAKMSKFLVGVSMGGGVAIGVSQLKREFYKGMILISPFISIENVLEMKVIGPIKNKHLGYIGGFLSSICPSKIVAPPAKQPNELIQMEVDNDPFIFAEGVRARVGHEFIKFAKKFMATGLPTSLDTVQLPFVVYHSVRDYVTDLAGSEAIIERAQTEDKKLLKVGIGHDVESDATHALTYEPGHEAITASLMQWITERV